MMTLDINLPDVLADMTAAFYRYEQALTGNDIAVLDELFCHSEYTVRYGASENLYGIEQIRAFRTARPSAGLDRQLHNTVITTYGRDMAVASTEFRREGSEKIGRQMQTWLRTEQGWRIVAAHVSVMV
ncbi:oxalurate catabolism protein HpxZ [Dickeya lacustris]|uniref:Oxalurate catabolism protein HpxZ n=1 Tax=Dickeya lacustris TaxID=2259638 RepID=A0ABY8G568_9GAMM|nr:oxalurate catabolism protein HpxZ [Dickeya lacustris]WFN55097.1 oxalurate catabolism protein HpxZ [Dickeya lacustris]